MNTFKAALPLFFDIRDKETSMISLSAMTRVIWTIALSFTLAGGAAAAPVACTAAQLSTAKAATQQARAMLQKVVKMMDDGDAIAVERMTVWLGVVNSAQVNGVKVRLNKAWAFLGGPTFLCDAADPAYARVTQGEPFTISLGTAFFAASNTGYSSKPGTLVHEVTHFYIAGASNDPPKKSQYGTKYALELAKSSPAKAQEAAENLEYFVEATFHGMSPPAN